MKKIEFIGPSGVGKSTLFRELVKRRTRDDHWITPEEATIQIARTLTFNGLGSIREKVFLGILKANILKKKQYGMAKFLLRDISERAFWDVGGRYDLLFEIHLMSTLENTDLKPRIKSWLASYYLQIARQVMLLEYCKIKEIVVFGDHCLLHNNMGLTNLSDYLPRVDPKYISNFEIDPLGMVYCRSDAITIFRQVKNRWKHNKGNILHRNLSDDQLYTYIEKSMIKSEDKVKNLKKRKVPVLEVDTSEDQAINTETINLFIRKLST